MVTDPFHVALLVTDILERCGLRYLVGGSLASAVSGEPRSTLGIVVVQGKGSDVAYVRRGADTLGVTDLFDRALHEGRRQ